MPEVRTANPVAPRWDEQTVKTLLAEPEVLLKAEPWSGWISQQGGLKAVYTLLRNLPLPAKHRKTLEALLSEPDATMQKYAFLLHVSVATYVRHRAALIKTLVTLLNAQALNQPPAQREAAQVKPITSAKTNVPRQRLPLIGREKELATVRRLLLSDGLNLLTLTGPGGMGKTRLTLEAVASLLEDFEHGAFFVSLAAITNPDLVAATIAQTLELKTGESRPIAELLQGYLQDKRVLLALDNFEQVTAAAPLLSELLAGAPALKILVTSRAVLHLYGEYEFVVPPLAIPDLKQLPAPAALAQLPAVALFLSRAQAVKTDFALTPENAALVAEICVCLEGIPLALELAAARIKWFSPQALLKGLSHRLTALAHKSPDRVPRHQTLRDAIAWSYQLLEPAEQALFMQLGVFVGGCLPEVVEAVCPGTAETPTPMLELLTALGDKSMLQPVVQLEGGPRFVMLETLREYALEQLMAAGQLVALQQRHLFYYLQWVEAIEPGPKEPNLPAWMKQLAEEHDNLRAALKWAVGQGEIEAALRLAGAIWRFWQIRGHAHEGYAWLWALLTQSKHLPTLARAKALWGAGWLGMVLGKMAEARAYFEEGAAIARAQGDKHYLGLALHGIGAVARAQGDFARAQTAFAESLPLFQALADTENVAWTFEHLGVTALEQGAFADAMAHLSQSLALFQSLEQRWPCGEALTFQGHAALQQGDYALAQERYAAALAIYEELEDRPNIAVINSYIGATLFGRGDYARAINLYKENLVHSQDTKDYWGLVWGIERLAEAAEKLQTPEQAARLWGAADALRHSTGVLWHPGFHSYYATERFAALKAQLTETVWGQLWAEGQALPLEKIVALALGVGA